MSKLTRSLAAITFTVVSLCSIAGADRAVSARVVATEIAGGKVRITISAGSSQGVERSWKARFVDDSGKAVPNGDLTLIRIDKDMTIAVTKLTAKESRDYRVQLEP